MGYQGEIEGVYLGEVNHVGPDDTPTGIYKYAVDSPVLLTSTGLKGDLQVDRRVHGGPEKALHHLPAENYAVLSQALPHLADGFVPGSAGENISTHGITDTDAHIGDIIRMGEALIQISQPRRPCWKVNHRYGNGHIAPLLMSQGITGWYYRVLEEGMIGSGDRYELIDRLEGSASVASIWQIFLEKLRSRKPIEAFNTDIPGLSEEWAFE
ncbi:MOSC domain-containing protein [uncultured Neptuniibacter sp.]|uniref:MOSC domain-containing protein n=1 Tax=uncultured Neptuniibacter sp. TaxID=502143 RepID=UPI002622A231|nr:MOSC domain-containing protein [uncultured Neptuniibacter sp.]